MKRLLTALLATLLLAGCQSELFSGVTERDANQIVAALSEVGITAKKAADRDGFTVTVQQTRFAEAVQLLDERGLPKRKYDTMGKVFEKSGFVSTPMEEKARYIYALSEELGRTISDIDGVITARVHVVTPEKDALGNTEEESSASVFLKFDPAVDIMQFSPFIKQLLSNAIPGLAFEKVSVIAVPAVLRDTPPSFAAAQMETKSATTGLGTETLLLVVAGLLFVLSIAGIGLWLLRDRFNLPSPGALWASLPFRRSTS